MLRIRLGNFLKLIPWPRKGAKFARPEDALQAKSSVESVEQVLARHQDLIDRIQRAAGTTPELFAQLYLPAIRNLVAHLHLLPSTEGEFLASADGLVRMSLEIGLHSLDGAHEGYFPAAGSVDKRSAMLPRWELATFLAGLCSQLYRPVTDMAVRDPSRRLTGWQEYAAFLMNRVIPMEVLRCLEQDNDVVLPTMVAAIGASDSNPSENPITKIVTLAITHVIQTNK